MSSARRLFDLGDAAPPAAGSDDGAAGAAPLGDEAALQEPARQRWSRKHVSEEERIARAKKLCPATQEILSPYMAQWSETQSKMLNCPSSLIVHELSPVFGAAARYTRASRWHYKFPAGHQEALNCIKLAAGDSGLGKSQAQRAVLAEFLAYEKTMGRDLVSRNMTIESLEARMFTNAQAEPQFVDGPYRTGSALLIQDEANKLVAHGSVQEQGRRSPRAVYGGVQRGTHQD